MCKALSASLGFIFPQAENLIMVSKIFLVKPERHHSNLQRLSLQLNLVLRPVYTYMTI